VNDRRRSVTETDPIDDARRALGKQLAAYRKAVGDSQTRLAAQIGYSRSTIANSETGHQHMSLDFWRRCDTALGAAGALIAGAEDIEELLRRKRRHLAAKAQAEREAKIRALRASSMALTPPSGNDDPQSLLHWPQPDADCARSLMDGSLSDSVEEDDVERRALLRLLAALGVGGTIPLDALERLRGGMEASIGLNGYLAVEDWERIAWEYGHAVMVQPAEQVVADLAVDIHEINRLVKTTKAPSPRASLTRVSAQLCALMADELHSLGMFGPAWRWWRTARHAADQSGDRNLRVWVLAREGVNAFNSPRPAASILALTDEAVHIAEGRASGGLAEAYKNRALGFMKQGDEPGALAALTDMRRAFDQLPESVTTHEDSIWGCWPERTIHMADSWVYTSFGAPAAATAQERALSIYPPEWRTPVTTAKLFQAVTLIQGRDIETGLAHAWASIESLPDDSRRRRPQILRVARQVHNELPDDGARALPAARDLQAFVNSMS
jgi:transcriptional regulator with XRE-family HTH domain